MFWQWTPLGEQGVYDGVWNSEKTMSREVEWEDLWEPKMMRTEGQGRLSHVFCYIAGEKIGVLDLAEEREWRCSGSPSGFL